MTARSEDCSLPAGSWPGDPSRRVESALHLALLGLTFALMILGALTRASGAGISCPDWPLCHGHLIPPLDVTRYPADPRYEVYKIYLEFLHRVLAGLVSIGAVALGVRLLRRKRAGHVVALWVVLALQIAMGAVTVRMRNAPVTVVIHLALALTFGGVVLHSARTALGFVPETRFRPAYRTALLLVCIQLLIGAVVSSRSIGLACRDFPLCNGLPLPAYWNGPIGWQFTHRLVGYAIFTVLAGLAIATRWVAGAANERTLTVTLLGLVCVQILLGGVNVWYRIPPAASAAHLAVAVSLFAVLFDRNVRASKVASPGS